MAASTRVSPPTSDDEECEDDRSDGRRRRFCIERRPETAPQPIREPPRSSRPRTVTGRGRIDYGDRHAGRRRKVPQERKRHLVSVVIGPEGGSEQPSPQPSPQSKGPVIFINPKFVKKFVVKSIGLASSNSNPSGANATISNSMIESVDLNTTPKESLQAASTMAIIRLVTECIQDDAKRDEKLNKILVSRLIESLVK